MAQLRVRRCPPARSRSRAAPSACRPTGSATSAWGIQFHAEVSAADAESWIDDYRNDEDAVRDRPRRGGAARRRRERKIDAWNELGRGLCERFLAAARRVAEPRARLLGRQVGAREAAVDQEGRGGDVARTRRWPGTAPPGRSRAASAKRPIGRWTRRRAALLGVLGEQLLQQRRVDRARAERVDAHAAARRTRPRARATARAPRPSRPCRRSARRRRPSRRRTRRC